MAQRRNAERGLVDAWTEGLGGPRATALLNRLSDAVACETLVRPIAGLPEHRGGEKGGRPAGPVMTMLKCVMLAKWFGLSDPQLEECLQDGLSFRRFVGLSFTDAMPNETMFLVFRRRLRDAILDRRLFDVTLEQLGRRGLLVKDATLIDATITEQARGEKTRGWHEHARSRGLVHQEGRGVESRLQGTHRVGPQRHRDGLPLLRRRPARQQLHR